MSHGGHGAGLAWTVAEDRLIFCRSIHVFAGSGEGRGPLGTDVVKEVGLHHVVTVILRLGEEVVLWTNGMLFESVRCLSRCLPITTNQLHTVGDAGAGRREPCSTGVPAYCAEAYN